MQPAVPRGYRFRPTAEELITHYLLKKVRGEELPWGGIHECDLYGEKNPWKICEAYDHDEDKFYFFTNLKKLKTQNRIARSAGCGTWQGNNIGDNIYDKSGKHVIGLNKLFSFKVKDGSRMEKSGWIMHEFSLAGVSLVGEREKSNKLVLCVLQRRGSEFRYQ
ncbi:NAC domain-containing protein 68 [Morella rubra]|uniref:NAC domain-containing protein 68 n=1 Tax=Morella rubra TaxID=262757 RepID=A0A6A1VDE0_9ROSI|nr:NAC domain-containing protein 68 [Morella rubra]